jgi:hypothetical protein
MRERDLGVGVGGDGSSQPQIVPWAPVEFHLIVGGPTALVINKHRLGRVDIEYCQHGEIVHTAWSTDTG